MRTRSQPDSPGGLVSLDDVQNTRRTRSTRSASRAASQEPAQSTQSAQPAPQTTNRSKTTQRTAKQTTTKKATSSKAASTKTTSTTSTAKPQTRTGSRRGTRSAARKADQDASDEAHESIEKENIDTARPETSHDHIEPNTENPTAVKSIADAALTESERECNTSVLSPELVPVYTPLPPSPLLSPSSQPSNICRVEIGQPRG